MRSGIVDCHFHVVAPPQTYPMFAARSYTPETAPLSRWQQTLSPLGVTHGVVVQPSFYGTDNRVLLQALAEGQGRLVGVAAVDASIGEADLDALAEAGVRGVRMAFFDAGDPRARGGFVGFEAFDALEPRLSARGMHLQLFTDSRLLPRTADRLRRSRVAVVIDHMGRSPAALGATHEGFDALCRLLGDGHVWVKLSGVANISDAAPDYQDARALHDRLVQANPGQLVWGSDWPHTRPGHVPPDTAQLFRLLQAWTPDEGMRERILVGNPGILYRLPPA
nr:amidohydrolase family protein [uncultured Roseateles sp.]